MSVYVVGGSHLRPNLAVEKKKKKKKMKKMKEKKKMEKIPQLLNISCCNFYLCLCNSLVILVNHCYNDVML